MPRSENPLEPASDEATPQSTVVVGDTPITMQQLQQIYAELTGKPESMSAYYDAPIRLSFNDIEQLYYQMTQTLE
jgi:hypothetical protein